MDDGYVNSNIDPTLPMGEKEDKELTGVLIKREPGEEQAEDKLIFIKLSSP